MKTLTELGGSVIRKAAAAMADVRRSLAREEKASVSAAPEVAPPATEGEDAAGEAVAEATAPDSTAAAPAPEPTAAAPAPAAPSPKREAESEAVRAALDEAIAKATGFEGDRVAILREAVEVVGARADDVRLVRVFGLDEPLRGAQVVGERQYVVDFFPPTMKQVPGSPRDERGRGGGRRGGRPGGGERGAKGSATGGFSMDSLREDRKNERGGRGRSGGGRAPGGSRPPSGPRSPPGGDPKK